MPMARGVDRQQHAQALSRARTGRVPLRLLERCRVLLLFHQHVVTDHQAVDVGGGEARVRLLGRADDRLAAHVEAGVHHERAARAFVEALQEPVVDAVAFVDGLDSRRVVDVGDGGELRPWNREPYPKVGIVQPDLLLVAQLAAPLLADRRHGEHVRAVLVGFHLEDLVRVVTEDGRRERSERLPELHLEVQGLLHLGGAGVTEDAAGTERPRPELHAALEPADDVSLLEQPRHPGEEVFLLREVGRHRAHRLEEHLDVLLAVRGAEEGALLGVRDVGASGARRARGATSGARRRRRHRSRRPRAAPRDARTGPSRTTRPFATQLRATPPAITRFLAPVRSCACCTQRSTAVSQTTCTDAARSISRCVMSSSSRRGGPPKSSWNMVRGHRVAVAVVEVVEVEPDGAVVVDLHELLEDQVDVLGIAVRREAHELVFAGVDLEARVVGEGGIQHAEGVRIAELGRAARPGSRSRCRWSSSTTLRRRRG